MSEALQSDQGFNLEAIKNLIAQTYSTLLSKALVEPICNSLSSTHDRLLFAKHHFELLKEAVVAAIDSGLQIEGITPLAADEEHINVSYLQAMWKVRIHATDCIQHLHAIGDTLAFAVYHLSELPEKNPVTSMQDITLKEVVKRLPDQSAYTEVLKQYAISDSYTYLEALNNHSKHRYITRPALDISSGMEIEDVTSNAASHEELIKFAAVDARKPSTPLPYSTAVRHVHFGNPITPFVRGELVRAWDAYAQVLHIVVEQLENKALAMADCATTSNT